MVGVSQCPAYNADCGKRCAYKRNVSAPIASRHCTKNTAVNLPRDSLFLIFGSESMTPMPASLPTRSAYDSSRQLCLSLPWCVCYLMTVFTGKREGTAPKAWEGEGLSTTPRKTLTDID